MTNSPAKNMGKKCPCGGGKYANCCGPFHTGTKLPRTAEQLMRSRYSAFARNLVEYIAATWHPSTRPEQLELSDNPVWLQLQIIASGSQGNRGYVHFIAYFAAEDGIAEMEEESEFIREQGRWWYLNAISVEH
ncbi:MAG: YchJ family metal-binding protein [Pseudidiomarina maritima]|nr:YchJ family metal-binding protein [Pseudidiomarina maritima]